MFLQSTPLSNQVSCPQVSSEVGLRLSLTARWIRPDAEFYYRPDIVLSDLQCWGRTVVPLRFIVLRCDSVAYHSHLAITVNGGARSATPAVWLWSPESYSLPPHEKLWWATLVRRAVPGCCFTLGTQGNSQHFRGVSTPLVSSLPTLSLLDFTLAHVHVHTHTNTHICIYTYAS